MKKQSSEQSHGPRVQKLARHRARLTSLVCSVRATRASLFVVRRARTAATMSAASFTMKPAVQVRLARSPRAPRGARRRRAPPRFGRLRGFRHSSASGLVASRPSRPDAPILPVRAPLPALSGDAPVREAQHEVREGVPGVREGRHDHAECVSPLAPAPRLAPPARVVRDRVVGFWCLARATSRGLFIPPRDARPPRAAGPRPRASRRRGGANPSARAARPPRAAPPRPSPAPRPPRASASPKLTIPPPHPTHARPSPALLLKSPQTFTASPAASAC